MKLNAGVELVGEGLVYGALVHLREHVTCTKPNPSRGISGYQTHHRDQGVLRHSNPMGHVTCIKPTHHRERDLHQTKPIAANM
jgi:hypothetical protein